MKKIMFAIAALLFTLSGIAKTKTIVFRPVRDNPTPTGNIPSGKSLGLSEGDTLYIVPGAGIKEIYVTMKSLETGAYLYQATLTEANAMDFPILIPEQVEDCLLEVRDNNGLLYQEVQTY